MHYHRLISLNRGHGIWKMMDFTESIGDPLTSNIHHSNAISSSLIGLLQNLQARFFSQLIPNMMARVRSARGVGRPGKNEDPGDQLAPHARPC